jgi:penicillin-binding protein 2A
MMKWIRYGIALASLVQSAGCNSLPATSPATPAASQELTYEEHVAFVPPPPEDLQAELEGNAVRLSWKAAEPVAVKHQYEDAPLSYKVFRHVDGEFEFVLLAEPVEPVYIDDSVQPGGTYYYAISGLYRNVDGSELNGSRSSEVSITIPNP